MLTDVSSTELRRLVLETKGVATVLFSGAWCPDCKEFRPTWEQWAKGTAGPLFKLEIPKGGAEWKDWNLTEIPTVAVFAGGREIGRIHGTISRKDLEKLQQMAKAD